jgi:hypothetical protein
MPSSDNRQAVVDMATALRNVYKKYNRETRRKAWKALISKKGQDLMAKLLNQTSRPVSHFRTLSFREWLNESQMPSKQDLLTQIVGTMINYGSDIEDEFIRDNGLPGRTPESRKVGKQACWQVLDDGFMAARDEFDIDDINEIVAMFRKGVNYPEIEKAIEEEYP